MFSALLYFLPLFPMQVLALSPLCHQTKYGLLRTIGMIAAADLLLFPVAALIRVRGGISMNLLLLLVYLVFLGLCLLLTRCPVCKTLSSALLICALHTILSNAACAVYAQADPTYSAEMISPRFALLQFGINTLAVIILYYPFRKYGSRLIDSLDIRRIWYMTLPFSLVLIISSQFIRPLRFETLFVNNVFRSFLFILSSSLILWILLAVIFHQIVTGILDAAETEEKMHMLEMQESQFKAQQEYLESSARTRHDFRQNVLTMKALCHEGDYEALGKYIDEYSDTLPVAETRRYCRNNALNALLNHYAGKAEALGFAAVFRIDLPDTVPVKDVDLCTIVGNILENALRASADIPEEKRNLTMTVQIRNNRLYIVATNAFSGTVRRHGSGIGLKSVQACAEKYGGTAAFSHDGTEFHSDVMLMPDR